MTETVLNSTIVDLCRSSRKAITVLFKLKF